MTSFRRIRTALIRRDEGVGLILVIGMSAVVAILVAVTTSTAIRSLNSSAGHVSFEQALSAAEAGVDRELSRVQVAKNQVPSDAYDTPSPCAPAAPAASVFTSESSEKLWAAAALKSLPSSCTVSNGQGQFVAFKTPGRQTVYSMGWSPSRTAANAKARLIKAEYIFGPFRPGHAILTGGNLNFSGSVTINTVGGSAASVHTNASVTGLNGSTNISGPLTASGSISGCSAGVTGGCLSSQPAERIPTANPRAVYDDFALTTTQWYDLCDDGNVHSPSTINAPLASDPCSGSIIAPSPYNNWAYTPGTATVPGKWVLDETATEYPGVYYVYGANAQVGNTGNASDAVTITVLAESKTPDTYINSSTCNKYGGDISWKLFDVQNYLRGTLFIAQGSIYGSANSSAQTGVMYAGDKISFNTSSASVTGAIVANNTCAAAGANTIQGMNITYDQAVEAPVYSVINTILWLEYVT